MYTIYYYPKCSTCRKALKWLENNNIEVIEKHIVEETPSIETLKRVMLQGTLPINKLFNTSGKLYRELNMKDKIKTIEVEEALELLSKNGMLIKRPIIVDEAIAMVGFKEDEWEKQLL